MSLLVSATLIEAFANIIWTLKGEQHDLTHYFCNFTLCVLFQSSWLQNIWSIIMAFGVGQALTIPMVYIIFILYLTLTCLARWQALELHYVQQKV
jgi:hypothetical protein